MQRYFSSLCEEGYYKLSSDDEYHIKKVMRMHKNDKIEIVDNKITYICEIESIEPLKIKVIEKISEDNENKVKVTIVQSLVNEQKMDYILQKDTELGAYSFYGYKAVNSVVKDNGKSDKKLLRWQKIVKEASEQSKRNIIPKVVNIIDINELCRLEADLKILLTVNEKTLNLKKVLHDNKKYDTMIIVVGPEGGFTPFEENKLIENGYLSVSLGSRVLRTETASQTILAMLNYEWMVE